MDYDGLKMLAKYHKYVALRKKTAEEKDWLKQSRQNCGELGINIDKINQHFQNNVWCTDSYNPLTSVLWWLLDDIIDIAFDVINKKHDDTICFCV